MEKEKNIIDDKDLEKVNGGICSVATKEAGLKQSWYKAITSFFGFGTKHIFTARNELGKESIMGNEGLAQKEIGNASGLANTVVKEVGLVNNEESSNQWIK